MKEVFGNLWDFDGILCITTNGTLRKDGACVMGRGVARQAMQLYPKLPKELGGFLKLFGNRIFFFQTAQHTLLTFPVKHNWWEKADLQLITQSVKELQELSSRMGNPIIYLPRPGCGNGGRTWEEVKPLVSVLPDNVYIVGWPNEQGS